MYNLCRPPVQGALGGMELGVAAHRLILNSLGNRPNSTGGAMQMLQRQQGNGVRGQEQGFFNSAAAGPKSHQGLGYGPRGQGGYNGAGYSGGDRQRPQSQASGPVSQPFQPHQVVPRAPPVHGGSGFMGRGGNPQAGSTPVQAPGPPNGWAPGRGVTIMQRQTTTYVARASGPAQNGFSALDGRGLGRGRGRGREPRPY
jgi:hypothetical protein